MQLTTHRFNRHGFRQGIAVLFFLILCSLQSFRVLSLMSRRAPFRLSRGESSQGRFMQEDSSKEVNRINSRAYSKIVSVFLSMAMLQGLQQPAIASDAASDKQELLSSATNSGDITYAFKWLVTDASAESKLLTTTMRSSLDSSVQSGSQSFERIWSEYSSAFSKKMASFKMPQVDSSVLSLDPAVGALFRDWKVPALLTVFTILYADSIQYGSQMAKAVEKQESLIADIGAQLQNVTALQECETKNYISLEAEANAFASEIERLTSSLEQKAFELLKLNETLTAVMTDMDSTLVDALRSEVIHLKKQLADNASMKAVRTTETDSKEMRQLKQSFSELKERDRTLLETLKRFLVQRGFVSESDAKWLLISTLPDALRKLESADIKASQNDKNWEEKFNAQAQTSRNLEEQLVKLREDVSASVNRQTQAARDAERKVDSLQNDIASYQNQLAITGKLNEELTAMVAESNARIELLVSVPPAVVVREEDTALKQHFATLQTTVDKLVAENKELKKQLSDLSPAKVSESNASEDYNKLLQKFVAETAAHAAERAILIAKVEAGKAISKELNAKLDEMNTEREQKLAAKVKALEEDKEAMAMQLNKMQSQFREDEHIDTVAEDIIVDKLSPQKQRTSVDKQTMADTAGKIQFDAAAFTTNAQMRKPYKIKALSKPEMIELLNYLQVPATQYDAKDMKKAQLADIIISSLDAQ